MSITIKFHQPAPRLSLNDRKHWRASMGVSASWKYSAKIAARGLTAPPCTVRVTFPVTDPGRRRDPHNMAPTEKAIIDGFVDAGLWPDDTADYVAVLPCRFVLDAHGQTGIVTVELEPL